MSDDKKEHPYIDELARDARGVCYNAFAKLIERADVIEEELLYANAQLEDAITERDAALEREQALAAHVELIIAAGDLLREPWDLSTILGPETRRRVEGWDKARSMIETPYDPLTKRDLIKQAEALEWMANEFDEQGEYRGYALQIEERAYKLRQQAAAL